VIVDARANPTGDLPERARALGIRVEPAAPLPRCRAASGSPACRSALQAGEGAVLEDIACDAVAMSGGWSPVVHLWSHCGGKLIWDETLGLLPPRRRPPADHHDGSAMVIAAGAANGALQALPD
jgi:sarcosine oxidase, subunit alpha